MKKLLIGLAATATMALGIAPTARAVDPVPVVTCNTTTLVAGETLYCTVTGTAGNTPVDKITGRTRGGKTNNVNNLAGQSYTITYTTSAADVNFVYETVSATIYLPASGHLVRPSSGSVSYTVIAAP